MSALLSGPLPGWAPVAVLGVYLTIGIGLGVLYFESLRWNTSLFARQGRMRNVIALGVARFACLAGVLTLVSLEGAVPLLMTALGVLVARSWVLGRAREAAS